MQIYIDHKRRAMQQALMLQYLDRRVKKISEQERVDTLCIRADELEKRGNMQEAQDLRRLVPQETGGIALTDTGITRAVKVVGAAIRTGKLNLNS